MIVQCENYDKTFEVLPPDTVGPEGATTGVYSRTKSRLCLYDPVKDVMYPWCPSCNFVDTEQPLEIAHAD